MDEYEVLYLPYPVAISEQLPIKSKSGSEKEER